MGKIVVLSDIHFGTIESQLGTHCEGSELRDIDEQKRNVDKFINALLNKGNIEEIIFLGDIFDFQLSNFSSSIKASQYFFSQLAQSKLNNNICYIPGNHDHTVWLYHVYHSEFFQKCLAGREIIEDFKFTDYEFLNNKSFFYNIFHKPKKFKIKYPIESRKIKDKRYLFTHGHFVDSKQKFYEKVFKKAFPLMTGDLTPVYNMDQLEILSCPLYEMFTIVGQTQKGRQFMSKSMEMFTLFWEEKHKVNDFRRDIMNFLKNYCGKWNNTSNNIYEVMDYFIFGHTHFADINSQRFKEKSNLVAINTGSWMGNQANINIIGEFVIIDSDKEHPEILILEKNKVEPVLHPYSVYLNENTIPKTPWEVRWLLKLIPDNFLGAEV